jgi:hypothetical protein
MFFHLINLRKVYEDRENAVVASIFASMVVEALEVL